MNVENDLLQQAVKHHQARNWNEAAKIYNALLNLDPYNETLLQCLGDMYLRVNHTALALHLLTELVTINPQNADAWNDLGIAHRMENRLEPAQKCWERAIEISGDTIAACSNMAGIYSDRALPHQAIEWIGRALAIDPQAVEPHWMRALARLSLRDWGGWDDYEWRKKLDTFHNRKVAPEWDWRPTEHLYVHGEQGIGDEVMFLSCLDEVLPLAKRVTLEINAAVANIARVTWPDVNVITDETPGDYTAQVALGSLPGRLRREDSAFPGHPYLRPEPWLVKNYRKSLRDLGPGPYVAVTWMGGTKKTRAEDRSLTPKVLRPILDSFTCVSAQYEHTNPYAQEERETAGIPKLDDASLGRDIHAQAALFLAVDCVATVQQTAVHVAGAVGAPTFAMIGQHPHWRYGVNGSTMPWYRSVELVRNAGNWDDVVQTVERKIADLTGVRRAKSANARAA